VGIDDPASDDEEPQNPFAGLPLFGDIAKLIGNQAGMGWSAASQLATSIATGGASEANVDPMERMELEQLARVAEMHIERVSGLSSSTTGLGLTIRPVNRSLWIHSTMPAYQPLFEHMSEALARVEPDDELGSDPAMAMFGPFLNMIGPMMLTMTAGSMVGHLATRALGQYDLPIPRPVGDEIFVVVPNIDEFGSEWSIDHADLRLWVCLHEIAHHAVLNVAHVRARMESLLLEYADSFDANAEALGSSIEPFDLTSLADPTKLAALQQQLGDPEAILGAMQSERQRQLMPELDTLVAVVVGMVDHLMDQIGTSLISSYSMVTEALRRRRVEASASDRFVERLLGLELSQATYDRGSEFVKGVVERAGDEGLARLWSDERNLPTPNEITAPGLWLARIDLPEEDDDPSI